MHNLIIIKLSEMRFKIFRGYFKCLAIFCIFLLTGCSPYEERFTQLYVHNNFKQSYLHSQHAIKNDSKNKLLWEMNSSFVSFAYINPILSISSLERADAYVNESLQSGILSSISANYKGHIYEASYINFYEALAHSSIGDSDSARVFFNRANDRERRAIDYYEKDISRAAENNYGQKRDETTYEIENQLNIESILNSKYSNLKSFRAFNNFTNPLISYISGIFFMQEEDYPKAFDLLKQSYGTTNLSIIAQDIEIMQGRENKRQDSNYTWIIIEDGDIATKYSSSFSFPFIIDGILLNIAMSLPNMNEGRPSFYSYKVSTKESEQNFYEIANISNMLKIEFSKQLPTIISKEVLSATIKVVGQYLVTMAGNEAMEGLGVLLNIAAFLATEAINKADTRLSIALPNSVYISRVKNTNPNISIYGDGKNIVNIEIDDECKSLEKRENLYKSLKHEKNSTALEMITKNKTLDKLCIKSDNILYIRVRGQHLMYSIVRGK